jgi:peroxiredoxin
MIRLIRLMTVGIALCGLVWATGCGQQASSSTEATGRASRASATAPIGVSVGLRAPDIALPLLTGETINLASLKGKVVLVNFWATWCGPCLMEMPSMQRLYQQYQRDNFEILAVATDFEGAPIVKPYVNRLRLTFPILLDPQMQVNDLYKVTGIPTSLIIDRDGIITHKFFGSENWDSDASHRLIEQILRARA